MRFFSTIIRLLFIIVILVEWSNTLIHIAGCEVHPDCPNRPGWRVQICNNYRKPYTYRCEGNIKWTRQLLWYYFCMLLVDILLITSFSLGWGWALRPEIWKLSFYVFFASLGSQPMRFKRILITLIANTSVLIRFWTPFFELNPKILRKVWEIDFSTFSRMGLNSFEIVQYTQVWAFWNHFWVKIEKIDPQKIFWTPLPEKTG